MTQIFDEIIAEAQEMAKAADEAQERDQQQQSYGPQQPAQAPQDDLAAAADRVLSQLQAILESSGVPLEQQEAPTQAFAPSMDVGGAPSGAPVININVGGGVAKTAERLLAEAALRLVDPTGAVAARFARGA